jgi:S-adenosyl-L-methionine hydrolase (adenosine-forming)
VKKRRGDTETRRHGDRTDGLRVFASATRIQNKAKSNSRSTSTRRPVSGSHFPPLITLLTDFGTADYFVGAMKGVILSINPQARIVDLTHEVAAQDIAAAAFTLLAAYESFAAGTIHVAVVDPGVGSARRPIVVAAADQLFVGPDNGIFSYIIEREPDARVIHLTKEECFRQPVSATFHGRDVFAPIAGALSLGTDVKALGVAIRDQAQLPSLAVTKLDQLRLAARIIHIDRFGNCITNITQNDLPGTFKDQLQLTINGHRVKSIRRFFAEKAANEKEKLFAVWGSAGFLEIAIGNRSAAKFLKARRGQTVLASRGKS